MDFDHWVRTLVGGAYVTLTSSRFEGDLGRKFFWQTHGSVVDANSGSRLGTYEVPIWGSETEKLYVHAEAHVDPVATRGWIFLHCVVVPKDIGTPVERFRFMTPTESLVMHTGGSRMTRWENGEDTAQGTHNDKV